MEGQENEHRRVDRLLAAGSSSLAISQSVFALWAMRIPLHFLHLLALLFLPRLPTAIGQCLGGTNRAQSTAIIAARAKREAVSFGGLL